jgi:hypothetical protein
MLMCQICHRRRADYYLEAGGEVDDEHTILVCNQDACNKKAEKELKQKYGKNIKIERTMV